MQSTSVETRTRSPLVWGAIGWLLAYSIFFFSFTLPNSKSVRRVDVWLELPELLWANVVTPEGAPESHWSNLTQRADLLAIAGAIWLGSWAIGSLSLRAIRLPLAVNSTDHLVLACGVGLSLTSLVMLGFGLLGWMSPWPLAVLLSLATVTELAWRLTQRTSNSTPRSRPERSWFDSVRGVLTRGEQIPYDLTAKSLAVVAMTLFLLAMLLGSLLPPTDFDVKAYHLTGPKEYFLNGRITFLEHNVYTNFPFLTEMLCLAGMVLRQDWFRGALAGQAVLMGFAPLTALGLFCLGRRWFGNSVGWLAATIYLTTPWTYRLAIIAYVEGALSSYLLLSLFALRLAWEHPQPRWFFVVGLCSGSAMACKYPGLVSVVIPMAFGSVLLKLRSRDQTSSTDQASSLEAPAVSKGWSWESPLLWFSLGTVVAVGPWLLKNLLLTGNPVYPLAYGVFGGFDWDAASHAKWKAGHSPATFSPFDFAVKFIDVTAKADWLSPLLFGFAPLAFLSKPRTDEPRFQVGWTRTRISFTALLALFGGYLFLQWWLLTHRIDRFWVPMIPVIALLAAIGCDWNSGKPWRWASGILIGLSVLFNLGFVTTRLCGFSAYLSDLQEARDGCESTAPAIQTINRLYDLGTLPKDAVVLCVGEAQVFDARPRVLYNVVFDQPLLRDWMTNKPSDNRPDSEWPLKSIDAIRREFQSRGVTHVLVNWQELLRYRTTYGYSNFVTPQRFAWLREQGLLDDPANFPQGKADDESLDAKSRRELDRWAPSLRRVDHGQSVFVTWQLFKVRDH